MFCAFCLLYYLVYYRENFMQFFIPLRRDLEEKKKIPPNQPNLKIQTRLKKKNSNSAYSNIHCLNVHRILT